MNSSAYDTENSHESPAATKLSLFSFPGNNKAEKEPPPGMLTPPFNAAVSVPFQWEEAPGKPRYDFMESRSSTRSTGAVVRCLELPPRLVSADHLHHHQAAVAVKAGNGSIDVVSPTTVLDGPYIGSGGGGGRTLSARKRGLFGSSRWGSFRKSGHDNKEATEDNFDFLYWDDGGGGSSGGVATTKVKITRFRKRSGSLMNLSHSNSHKLLTSIYESFKQAVPWRRRQGK